MTPHTHIHATHSGLMDKHTLTSTPQPPSSHRYVAGVLKDGKQPHSSTAHHIQHMHMYTLPKASSTCALCMP